MELKTQSTPRLVVVTRPKKSAKTKVTWLRVASHMLGWTPLAFLAYKAWLGDLTANPIQFIEQALGRDAVYMLLLTMAITPVATISGLRVLPKYRRTLGLYAFFYFSLHFLTFAVVDYGLNWKELFRLSIEKPFIYIGILAGSILVALALTSFKYWMKRLGKSWKKLHRMVYLASVLVILHYALAVKGSLVTLSGNILQPLEMGGILIILLILRIPPIRRRMASLQYRSGSKISP